MRYITRMLILGLMLMASGLMSVMAQQQAPEWEAWVYNSDNGRMLRVGSDRSIYEDFTLPGLQGNFYPNRVVVSPDGRIIVYTLSNQNNGLVTVYAYDTIVNDIAASFLVPSQQGELVYTNVDILASEQIFSPDGTSVAIGYTINGEWSLVVMDLFNTPGNISLQLNESDPLMSPIPELAIDVPVVVNYDGFVIDFVIVPAATEGLPAYPHFTYDSRTNNLSPNIYYTIPWGDFNPRNGSYVFPIADFRYSPADDRYQFRGEHINSLHLHQTGTDTIYPIYTSADTSLGSPVFIQNGEKILFRTYNASTNTSDWAIMEDLGAGQYQLYGLTQLTDFFPSGVESTGDGMLMSMEANNALGAFNELASYPNRSILMSFNTRADNFLQNSGTIIWIGEENQSYNLVWAKDNRADTRPIPPVFSPQGDAVNLSTYGTLSQFAQNLQDSLTGGQGGGDTTGNLAVGGQAQVFTTEGDRANMRSDAGTSFPVVEALTSGTVVSVMGGPVNNGGFVWWQVRVGTNSGWVVESADGVRVLQPYGVPPTPVISTNPTLLVGGQAVVTADGNNLNARQNSSTSASIVAVYQTGDVVSIIGGPVNNEGFVWWQISTDFGPAWVAEGTSSEQWIIGANG